MSLSTSSGVRCSRLRRSPFGTRVGGLTFPFSGFGRGLRVGRNCTTLAMAPSETLPFMFLLGKVPQCDPIGKHVYLTPARHRFRYRSAVTVATSNFSLRAGRNRQGDLLPENCSTRSESRLG